jgi:hypothetical protein
LLLTLACFSYPSLAALPPRYWLKGIYWQLLIKACRLSQFTLLASACSRGVTYASKSLLIWAVSITIGSSEGAGATIVVDWVLSSADKINPSQLF